MKFSMNGALTLGTLDGANIEIRDEVGAENFFLFGLTAPEVAALQSRGYRPIDHYHASAELRDVIDLLRAGIFSRGDTELFRPLIDGLLRSDPYFVLLNSARSGRFSSDRTIREYCSDIWKIAPVPIQLLSQDEVKAGFLQ